MKLEGKKIALLLDQEYQELELWYPYYRLGEEGAEIVRVAPKAGETYKSKLGYPCISDAAAGDAGVGPRFSSEELALYEFFGDGGDVDSNKWSFAAG